MLAYLTEYHRYLNLLGIVVVLTCAFLFSFDKKRINARLVATALALQALLGFVALKTAWGTKIIGALATGVCKIYGYAGEGAQFVFGSLAKIQEPWGVIFAFRVLPVIIFFSALIALLFHWRIIQFVTYPITWLLYRLFGTSAAETLCAVANGFLSGTEAPLLIRSYLAKMTQSELFTVMVSGMGTTSAPLFVVYASLGAPLQYVLSATIMAIPATILISKMLIPETETPATQSGLHVIAHDNTRSALDALSEGTSTGVQIVLAIGAMLIAFIALVALGNGILGGLSHGLQALSNMLGLAIKIPVLTLQAIFGILFAPVAWLMGLPAPEILPAGELLGIKVVLNELVAFGSLASLHLSERAVALLTFALCGFANFSFIGIEMAGIGAIEPSKRSLIGKLGMRAVFAGTLANLLSAFIAGLML